MQLLRVRLLMLYSHLNYPDIAQFHFANAVGESRGHRLYITLVTSD